MEITTEIIKELLDSMVLPMFNGIKEIEIESLSLFDDPNILYPIINVIFYKKKFFEYKNADLLEYEISKIVKSVLKYLNITESIVDVYITSE